VVAEEELLVLLAALAVAMAVLVELAMLTTVEASMVLLEQQAVVVVVQGQRKTLVVQHQAVLVEMVRQFTSTTKMKEKLYAIIINDIVEDCWFAETKEEAQADHPTATVIEITVENSPVHRWQKYPYEIKER
jgi:hypothetical protein